MRTVAYLAERRGSASIEEQRIGLHPGDHVVLAGKWSFNKLTDMLAETGIELRAGDRVKLYDLSCITLATTTLIATISKMLREGISFEIISSDIIIEPGAADKVRVMLDALDAHYRHLHGVKIHRPERKGRRRKLAPNQLTMIREELDKPGATAMNVAKKIGVARSTLFNFLERYDREHPHTRRRKGDESEQEVSKKEAAVRADKTGKGGR